MFAAKKNEWRSQGSCQKVRASCQAWMEDPQHRAFVSINAPAISTMASEILARQRTSPHKSILQWDEDQWHYVPSSRLTKQMALERLALYIVALDSINFCFWPSHKPTLLSHKSGPVENLEYEHLARAMAYMAQQDEEYQLDYPQCVAAEFMFQPNRMANLSAMEMTFVFEEAFTKIKKPNSEITQLDNYDARCRAWNEVGRVLGEEFDGSVLKFLRIDPNTSTSAMTAPQMVDRIVQYFPMFRDCVPWQPREEMTLHPFDYLYFYKRAQILVGDLNAALKLHLEGFEELTMFADYRVPQLLRHTGVLQYSAALEEAIDSGREIQSGCLEERTIRAATVVAVEQLVKELMKQQEASIVQSQSNQSQGSQQAPMVVFTPVTVDWYLWHIGEKMHQEGSMKPHHKTRTTFY